MSFNGATLIRAWKRPARRKCTRGTLASMEPRSFERGNHGRQTLIAELLKASMEPRSFERGNQPPTADSHAHLAQASMEPRSFERGNPARKACLSVATCHRLQWSHAHSSVETAGCHGT